MNSRRTTALALSAFLAFGAAACDDTADGVVEDTEEIGEEIEDTDIDADVDVETDGDEADADADAEG